MTVSQSPVRVDAVLDHPLSRGLWLVKWLLAIPHLIVLVLLWAAFAVLSVVAFFAILFTGRYPRPIFDFNVGVLRWTWRVAFYAYGALGTDRYPPFTLDEVPEYPAHLQIDYPDHLSRGLVLVKWWLLAIPHYLVLGFFLGGGLWLADEVGETDRPWAWGSGLIGLLVLFAAVVLLFTGRYPQPIFDLVLGMQRWVLRVAAYAGLMSDAYPPFRLDLGGDDPSPGNLTVPAPTGPGASATEGAEPRRQGRSGPGTVGWTAGRTAAVVTGAVTTLLAVGLLAAAGTTLYLDRGARDDAGFVTSPEQAFSTSAYALTTDTVAVRAAGVDATLPGRVVGDVRLRVTAAGNTPVFVGVASAADVQRYLDGVAYTTVAELGEGGVPLYLEQSGVRAATAPAGEPIWVAQAAGAGTQDLAWEPRDGDWTVVVMNRDGSRGVEVVADAGAELPVLGWVWGALFAAGGVSLAAGVVLIAVALGRRDRRLS